jgi:2-dehydro-3-deoxyphosphogluconate aldolase/(4S)-4-hydroxy-2-oxoglutarate aldolase
MKACEARALAAPAGAWRETVIATAEEMGVEIVKLFPARAAGGADFIRQLLGPAPATRLLPTGIGEVSAESIATWFKAGACAVGIGGELIAANRIAAGDFAAIAGRVAEVREMVRQARQ